MQKYKIVAKCSIKLCTKNAVYGRPDTTNILCGEHKMEGMIDMRHARCECCDRRPTYYYPGKPWSHCREHASPSTMEHRILARMYIIQHGICYEIPPIKKCVSMSYYLNITKRVLKRKVARIKNPYDAAEMYHTEIDKIYQNAAKYQEYVPYIPKVIKDL